ncbi:MAG: HAD family hydrolase [Eubacteriales bacterium]|nr:HAD family hydrolase [Bacillota bacterium]MBV1726847.1 HAD family hydrolase [Desulforudis sp.]MDP3049755.1 HAD family hydrolase [Eubacteriales bacterium]MDQ7789046.1 HAD family hydrolase [Clostridia bacterium]MBV1736020.1 HAD family hydrolase [Desulforudis sp.]
MLSFEIPGRETLNVRSVVADYNGTLAINGQLIPGVRERLNRLAESAEVVVITADTYGTVRRALSAVNCRVIVLDEEPGGPGKQQIVRSLGAPNTVAFGNGAIDALMLREAGIGVAVLIGEGAASACILAADVVVTSINDGLDLLLVPDRLKATLRW